jgi:alpha/beta superfamily hydrolase
VNGRAICLEKRSEEIMSQIAIWSQSLDSNPVNWTSTFIILGSLLILLILVYFGFGAFIASRLSLPKRVFDPSNNPGIFNLLYEEIRFPARTDGLGIAAWYIPSDKNERAIVLVHGRDDSRTNAFGGEFVSFANVLHQAGFSVLMIDLRGHGQSDVSRYTFGIRERLDVLGAVDWLESRGFKSGSIGVLGYSLGGGSVIGAASEDEAIAAIWLDSAFGCPVDPRAKLED